jgi:hypothetical protein
MEMGMDLTGGRQLSGVGKTTGVGHVKRSGSSGLMVGGATTG